MNTGVHILIFSLLLASGMLGGCSYTAPVTFESTASERGVFTLTMLNQRLAGKNILLRTVDSAKIRGQFIECSVDSCRILSDEADTHAALRLIALPNVAIRNIEYKDHPMGALIGFFSGAGSAYMIFTGSSVGRYDAYNERLVGGSEFLLGGLAGCVVGWLAGQSCVYQLPDSSSRAPW